MQASAALSALVARARRPRNWGAALLFGLVWNLTRLALGIPVPEPIELLLPGLWGMAFLLLAPLPWQWTGDARRIAGPGRGIAQALPTMGALVLGVLLLFEGRMHGPGMGGGRGPGRGRGRMELAASPLLSFIPPRLWLLAVGNLSFGLLLGWVLADRERAEGEAVEAQGAAREAQARALQAQMNPHVLFNVISGLTELVRENPAAAEEALVNLAGMLRGLLDHGARLNAPLGQERRLVEQLLLLEGIRLGKRLKTHLEWPESLDSLQFPPLLIQPLVENAIRHGISRARGGGALEVRVTREGNRVHIRVANTGPAPDPGSPEGLGLRNLQARLELLGQPGGRVRLERQGEWTVAELSLEARP